MSQSWIREISRSQQILLLGRWATCLFLVACVGLLGAVPGEACSCGESRHSRHVLPADGSTDIPVDAVIRVFLLGFDPELRSVLGSEYRLLDVSGDPVSLETSVVGTRLDLRPLEPLAENSLYTLEQVFAYGPSGLRLTDFERWEYSLDPLAPNPLGAWFSVGTFRTGGSKSKSRELSLKVGSFGFGFGGPCSAGVGVGVALEMPSGIVDTDVVELRVERQSVVVTKVAEGVRYLNAQYGFCSSDPVVVAFDPPMRAQVTVLDITGTRVAATEWLELTGPPESEEVPDLPEVASEPAAVERWSEISVGGAAGVLQDESIGPRACPYGFEVTSWEEISDPHAAWGYGFESTLVSDGGVGWMALPFGVASEEESSAGSRSEVRLFSVAQGLLSESPTSVASYPTELSLGKRGPLLLTFQYDQESQLRSNWVQSLSVDGDSLWVRELPGEGSDHRMASGVDKVLVAWRTPDEYGDSSLNWVLLDEIDGSTLGEGRLTEYRVDTNYSRSLAVALVDGSFFLTWSTEAGRESGPIQTMVVRPEGSTEGPRLTSLVGHGPLDLAPAGSSAGFVYVEDGQILWTLLNRDGEVEQGPVVVSSGIGGQDNASPRIAWNGNYFAVVWRVYPGAFVAAVDLYGKVSPALRLHNGPDLTRGVRSVGGVGVAAVGSEFLASWTEGREVARVTDLSCRFSRREGAPQRVKVQP